MSRILIIDDDDDLRMALSMRLASEGFQVEDAPGISGGLKVIELNPPDIIVMDVIMPEMDGLTALKKINSITGKKIPVIIMTGTASLMEDVFRLEGAKGFLKKPFDSSKLLAQIRKIQAAN